VQKTHEADWHVTLRDLFPEIQKAHAAHDKPRTAAQLARLPHPATELAIQTQLLEFRNTFDLAAIQEGLVPVAPRKGYGWELQTRCNEQANDPKWFDAVSDPVSCSSETLEVDALQQSALYQCKSWCIWDLRTQEQQGWAWNGQCFRSIKPGDKQCQQWFSQKPSKVLT